MSALRKEEAKKARDREQPGVPMTFFEGWFKEPEMWLAGEDPEPLPPADPHDPDIVVILYKRDPFDPPGRAAAIARERVEQARIAKEAKKAAREAAKKAAKIVADEGEGRIDGDYALTNPNEEDLKKTMKRRK